jgi:hypothetical protein
MLAFSSMSMLETLNVVVVQKPPKIIRLQPVIQVNLVEVGSHKLLSQLMGFAMRNLTLLAQREL